MLKSFLNDVIWVAANLFFMKLPSWTLRRIFLMMCGLQIARGSRIGINTVIVHPWKIKIGKNSIINENSYLDGRGGLEIGNNSSISIYSKILTASHNIDSDEFEYTKHSVQIKNNCFVGMSSIILPGTTLEDGVVVGAGAVKKGKTERLGIYTGNPAKLLRHRDSLLKYSIESDFHFR